MSHWYHWIGSLWSWRLLGCQISTRSLGFRWVPFETAGRYDPTFVAKKMTSFWCPKPVGWIPPGNPYVWRVVSSWKVFMRMGFEVSHYNLRHLPNPWLDQQFHVEMAHGNVEFLTCGLPKVCPKLLKLYKRVPIEWIWGTEWIFKWSCQMNRNETTCVLFVPFL